MIDLVAPMTESELQALCIEWQRELGLASWEIDVRIVRARDLGDIQGRCQPSPEAMRACIGILDPIDYPTSPFPQDMEQTLVHELLHCYHHASHEGTRDDLLEEQGVDMAARALVRLRRAARAAKPAVTHPPYMYETDSATPPLTTGKA